MPNKIRDIREANGLTQENLANLVRITRPYLSYIENNKKKPGIDISLRIARALDTSVENLFAIESQVRKKSNFLIIT